MLSDEYNSSIKNPGTICSGIHVVAEAGLEPRDLRVMSPTSYQLLHSAMYKWCS